MTYSEDGWDLEDATEHGGVLPDDRIHRRLMRRQPAPPVSHRNSSSAEQPWTIGGANQSAGRTQEQGNITRTAGENRGEKLLLNETA